MDSATEDLYYQRLNELIQDEDSIVTCPSIAAELKIGLRDAKSLITKYLNDNRHLKPMELAVTYLLSGVLKDQNILSVQLVKEAELEEKKKLFKSAVLEQVFSIQKCKDINFNMIALVNRFDSVEPPETRLLQSIVTPNFIKRNLKIKKLPVIQPKPTRPGFFSKLPPKTEQPTELPGTSKEPLKPKIESKPKSKSQLGGISNFFTKGASKTNGTVKKEIENIKPVNGTVEKKDDPESDASVNKILEVVVENREEMEVDDVEIVEKKVSEKENVKKRRKNKQKSEMPNKKRKRIQEIHDSDSDDMFGDGDDNEDIIEKSDEESELPPVDTTPVASKNKIRKAVDRTYEDEEGFIVTKTEYVFESAPEDEVEVKPLVKVEAKPKVVLEKKNSTTDSENDVKGAARKGKKNNKKPVSGNQPTLMSFFKRN